MLETAGLGMAAWLQKAADQVARSQGEAAVPLFLGYLQDQLPSTSQASFQATVAFQQHIDQSHRQDWSKRVKDAKASPDVLSEDHAALERAQCEEELAPETRERLLRSERRRFDATIGAVPGLPVGCSANPVNHPAEPITNVDFGSLSPTPQAPQDGDIRAQIAAAAAQVDPNPSIDQKRSGNYRKGHLVLYGLPITLENAKGGVRRGVDKDGKEWETQMNSHYGYFNGTKSDADNDHVDVFLGDHPESKRVFIVDQANPDGTFNEHKVLMGYPDADAARQGYLDCYTPGWKGLGTLTEIGLDEFKDWLANGDTSRPARMMTDEAPAIFSDMLDRVDMAAEDYSILAAMIDFDEVCFAWEETLHPRGPGGKFLTAGEHAERLSKWANNRLEGALGKIDNPGTLRDLMHSTDPKLAGMEPTARLGNYLKSLLNRGGGFQAKKEHLGEAMERLTHNLTAKQIREVIGHVGLKEKSSDKPLDIKGMTKAAMLHQLGQRLEGNRKDIPPPPLPPARPVTPPPLPVTPPPARPVPQPLVRPSGSATSLTPFTHDSIKKRLANYPEGDRIVQALVAHGDHVGLAKSKMVQAKKDKTKVANAVTNFFVANGINVFASDSTQKFNALPPEKKAELDSLKAIRAKVDSDVENATKAYQEASKAGREQLIQLLTPAVKQPLTIKIRPSIRQNPELAGAVRDGLQFIQAITSSSRPSGIILNFGKERSNRSRAKNDGDGKASVLMSSGDPAIVAHEIGHTLEYHLPGLMQAAIAFRDYRCGSEPLQNLRRLYGHSFDSNETGRKDNFSAAVGGDRRAYYVGKDYGNRATEIVSMGIEQLHRDPAGMAKADPEYFKFLVAALRGDLHK